MKKRGLMKLFAMALVLALVFEAFVSLVKGVKAAEQFGSTVSVKTKALKKAKANIAISLNGVSLTGKAFTVKGKVDGVKDTFVYVPAQELVALGGGQYTEKGKKVTISVDDAKITFKQKKNSYTITVKNEYGKKEKFTLKCGTAYKKDGQIYVPLQLIDYIAMFTDNMMDYELDTKAKTLDISVYPAGNMIVGGWSEPETPDVPEELVNFFTYANEANKDDEQIIPIAVLEQQVVAGMNYKLLCRISNPSKNVSEVFAIVVIYVDLQGNVEVTSEEKTNIETNINDLPGGWSQFESAAFPPQYLAVFEGAISQLDGVSYKPVALVAQQVTTGMNLCILCEATVVYPGAEPYYVFVYANVNPLTQTGEITDFKRLDTGSQGSEVPVDDNNGTGNQDSGDDKGLKIPGSENAVEGVDYKQMSGNYYAVTSLAGLAKVCEMEELPNGEFKTNIAGIKNDIIIDVPIETLGYVEINDGAVVVIEKGGVLQASIDIAEGCQIIVKDGGKLQTTMGGELCVQNRGEIIIEKGGLMQSMFGGTINNFKEGKITIDGDFYCGCVNFDNSDHVWFVNQGTVSGKGKVSLYGRGMDGKVDLNVDYCMSEMKKMLGDNTKITVVFDDTIDF